MKPQINQRRITFTLEEAGGGKLTVDEIVDVDRSLGDPIIRSLDRTREPGRGATVLEAALDYVRKRVS